MTMKFYQVFRKDWDTIKTHCARGGDVLFAVRRRLRCTSVSPANDDSLPDQMYVSLSGSLKTIFLMISSSYTTLMWTTSLIFVYASHGAASDDSLGCSSLVDYLLD